MRVYVVVAVLSLILLPLAYRRSGSMTRYRTMTGAPVIWVLLAASSLVAVVVAALGGEDTGHSVFTGGLIGTAFTQVVLLRRGDTRAATRIEGQEDGADVREAGDD